MIISNFSVNSPSPNLNSGRMVHAGTSSLGRPRQQLPPHTTQQHKASPPVVSPNASVVSSTHSSLHSRTLSQGSSHLQSPQLYPSSPVLSSRGGFPKTNGSLPRGSYESLSLGRPSSRSGAKDNKVCHLQRRSSVSNGGAAPTQGHAPQNLDAFDDPMNGARSSFKSFESTMQRFSQIFNEIKCNR